MIGSAPPRALAEQGACRNLTPHEADALFYPDGRGHGGPYVVSIARRICASCPVRDLCARYAIAAGERGMWGGLTENEREEIVKLLRARRHLAAAG